jgi:hypothetical protein
MARLLDAAFAPERWLRLLSVGDLWQSSAYAALPAKGLAASRSAAKDIAAFSEQEQLPLDIAVRNLLLLYSRDNGGLLPGLALTVSHCMGDKVAAATLERAQQLVWDNSWMWLFVRGRQPDDLTERLAGVSAEIDLRIRLGLLLRTKGDLSADKVLQTALDYEDVPRGAIGRAIEQLVAARVPEKRLRSDKALAELSPRARVLLAERPNLATALVDPSLQVQCDLPAWKARWHAWRAIRGTVERFLAAVSKRDWKAAQAHAGDIAASPIEPADARDQWSTAGRAVLDPTRTSAKDAGWQAMPAKVHEALTRLLPPDGSATDVAALLTLSRSDAIKRLCSGEARLPKDDHPPLLNRISDTDLWTLVDAGRWDVIPKLPADVLARNPDVVLRNADQRVIRDWLDGHADDSSLHRYLIDASRGTSRKAREATKCIRSFIDRPSPPTGLLAAAIDGSLGTKVSRPALAARLSQPPFVKALNQALPSASETVRSWWATTALRVARADKDRDSRHLAPLILPLLPEKWRIVVRHCPLPLVLVLMKTTAPISKTATALGVASSLAGVPEEDRAELERALVELVPEALPTVPRALPILKRQCSAPRVPTKLLAAILKKSPKQAQGLLPINRLVDPSFRKDLIEALPTAHATEQARWAEASLARLVASKKPSESEQKQLVAIAAIGLLQAPAPSLHVLSAEQFATVVSQASDATRNEFYSRVAATDGPLPAAYLLAMQRAVRELLPSDALRLIKRAPQLAEQGTPCALDGQPNPDEIALWLACAARRPAKFARMNCDVAPDKLRQALATIRPILSASQAAVLELAIAAGTRQLANLARAAALARKVEQPGARLDEHYRTYELPKQSGGTRTITIPQPWLKRLQRAIYTQILEPLGAEPAAHGFVPGRSILSNAVVHTGKPVVVNCDISGAFPSVPWWAISAALSRDLGSRFSKAACALLLDSCTFKGGLPIGAPSSPQLLNRVLAPVDVELSNLAEKRGVTYSRYADDLTFSGGDEAVAMLPHARRLLGRLGLRLDTKKTNIYRRGRRQVVTGLAVNERVSVPRRIRRRLRAAVHRLQLGQSATWHGEESDAASVKGRLAFLQLIHPDEARRLRARLEGSSKEKQWTPPSTRAMGRR